MTHAKIFLVDLTFKIHNIQSLLHKLLQFSSPTIFSVTRRYGSDIGYQLTDLTDVTLVRGDGSLQLKFLAEFVNISVEDPPE